MEVAWEAAEDCLGNERSRPAVDPLPENAHVVYAKDFPANHVIVYDPLGCGPDTGYLNYIDIEAAERGLRDTW